MQKLLKKNLGFRVGFVALLLIVSIVANAGAAGEDSGSTQERPNVILVLTDDQGYGDLSVHGNPVLETPVLDRLHDQSVRFHNFHVAPMCTPTRGELMTGRDAKDNGATMVNQGRSMMRAELPTMANIFKKSGYHTAHFGKWHLGDSYPHRPQDRGFEETVHHGAWGVGSMADYYTNDYWDDRYSDENGEWEKYEGYCTDVWFDLAIEYLEKQAIREDPFFMYLATNAPHGPHLVDDKYSDPYEEQGIKPRVAKFFGQIANIDENMGRLMAVLNKTGLAENTILIFMTDNGTARGHTVFNAGMRGHKTEPYEGGHRVPLFIRWPAGNIGEPRQVDELTRSTDLLPTLIDFCQLKKQENVAFDGHSLAPRLRGKEGHLADRKFVIEYDNPYRPKENKAVLWQDWRLVKNTELYDLSEDPDQQTDVAREHPEVVAQMQSYYNEWKNKTMPDYNKARYIHIGSEQQNPLMLYSSDWQGDYADGLWNLIEGDDIGSWRVQVETPGKYEITLFRWHPVSDIAMNAPYNVEEKQQGGALPVARARLKVGDIDRTSKVPVGASKVQFTVNLEQGPNRIATWLMDNKGEILCSAYYTKVELIN